MNQDRRSHWEGVYEKKRFDDVSWYQDLPASSLEMIAGAVLERSDPIIDIGGGASTLVDQLIELGYTDLTVLDISAQALAQDPALPMVAAVTSGKVFAGLMKGERKSKRKGESVEFAAIDRKYLTICF